MTVGFGHTDYDVLMHDALFDQVCDEADAVRRLFREHCRAEVLHTASLIARSLTSGGSSGGGGKLVAFGNGGSAADAQHLVAELVVRFVENRKALPAVCCNVDPSILTAAGNDFGYGQVFARQVEALARPGDVVVGITTSGSSKNVIAALQQAKSQGVTTIALTGQGPNAATQIADAAVAVPSKVTARVQECHTLTLHLWCGLIERELGSV
jgi:D-sedoheptulose 7-phosphate isomerase